MFCDGFEAIADVHFLADVLDVSPHRGDTDSELFAYFLVNESRGQQGQDLVLARRQIALFPVVRRQEKNVFSKTLRAMWLEIGAPPVLTSRTASINWLGGLDLTR